MNKTRKLILLLSVYVTVGLILLILPFFSFAQDVEPNYLDTASTDIKEIDGSFNLSKVEEAFLNTTVVHGEKTIGDESLDVFIPAGTSIKVSQGKSYSGTFEAPTVVDTAGMFMNKTYSVIHIGSYDENLYFYDEDGEPTNILVRVPVHSFSPGRELAIFSSSDGITWQYDTKGVVTIDNGVLYVEFFTNHLTFFSLGSETGTFEINNDDLVTYSESVTLYQVISGATEMRFADTEAELDTTAYVPFAGTESYDLSGLDGNKTVFAEFKDSGGTTGRVSDNIVLNRLARGGRVEGVTYESGWITVFYQKTYNSLPVVIATPTTDNNGNNYPIPRIRNVTTSSFQLSVCVDNGQTTCQLGAIGENIDYIVFDKDIAGGLNWIDVGTVNGSTDGSNTPVSFSGILSGIPQVWSTAQTSNQGNNIAAASWAKDILNISMNLVGCVHPGVDNFCDTSSPSEVFGYVAIDPINADINILAGLTSMANSAWTNFSFPGSFSDPVFMATQNSDNGPEDTQYPWIRNVGLTGGQTRYCEPDGPNYCDNHAIEIISWGVIDNFYMPYLGITYSPFTATTGSVVATVSTMSSGVMITNNGGSNSYTFTDNGSFSFEFIDSNGYTGSIVATVNWITKDLIIANKVPNVSSTGWTTVSFSKTYNNIPVVLAEPATDNNGDNYPIPSLRNITTTGFEVKICVDAGATTCGVGSDEDIHYFVVDTDIADQLTWIDAGTINTATDGTDTLLTFSQPFGSVPYVRTTSQTSNQGNNIAAVAWNDGNTLLTANLIGCVHQGIGNSCTPGQPSENIGYVAIDVTQVAIDTFQYGSENISNSNWTPINFNPSYIEPIVMVTTNSDNGGQDPKYSSARNITSTGAEIRYCEEDGPNDCDNHTSEVVRWFSMESSAESNVSLNSPSSYTFANYAVDNVSYNITEQIPTHFSVVDDSGLDPGYYTTLQVTDLVGSFSTILDSTIEIQSTIINTLAGSSNTNVVLGPGMTTFQVADTPLIYIKRDPGSNGGLKGEYGAQLSVRIPIQAYTSPDFFTGQILYTLYEN